MIREENINCTVEALILASPEPVSIKKLSDILEDISSARIRQAVDDLNNVYMGCGNSFRIREVAGGYQVHILPDFEQAIKKMLVKQRTVRLSRAALETLAIIAYKQPVTKIEIEHIRGVATDGVIHNLMERQLIIIAGRSESPGRPLLYKTSSEFLKFFGLNRLSDLPRLDEIEEMIRMADAPKEQTVLALEGNEDKSLEQGSAEDDFSDDEPASADRESDLVESDLVVTADVSEFESELDASDDDDFDDGDGFDDTEALEDFEDMRKISENRPPSGNNGHGDSKNIGEIEEIDLADAPESLPDIESDDFDDSMIDDEPAAIDEPVDEAENPEKSFSLPDFYDPIPDIPPAISERGEEPSGD